MEPTTCLHPIEGGSKTVSRQAIPYPKDPQGYSHEGDRPTCINRSYKVAAVIAMGLTFIHNPKAGSDSAYYLRF